jgi:(p)ppGpp synthase/HD superfamily hydrolase
VRRDFGGMMSEYSKALELATKYHDGQKRWNGEPYINHCIRVAQRFEDIERAKVVAVLHDIIEDTEVTVADLQNWFDDKTAFLIRLLTRDKEDSYLEYILKIRSDPIATAVKLSDLDDNLNGSKGSLHEKYLLAKYILDGGA